MPRVELSRDAPVVVELPDHRFVAIHPLDTDDESDSLVSELLESNEAFRDLVVKSAHPLVRPDRHGGPPTKAWGKRWARGG